MGKEKLFGDKINTNGFDKNPENINRKGQPRKLISDVIVELENEGVKATSKEEVKECYLRLINLTQEELTQRQNDSSQPMLIHKVAKAILSGKGLNIIETMLDRAIGKADQKTDSNIVISGDLENLLNNYNNLNDNK